MIETDQQASINVLLECLVNYLPMQLLRNMYVRSYTLPLYYKGIQFDGVNSVRSAYVYIYMQCYYICTVLLYSVHNVTTVQLYSYSTDTVFTI